MTTDYFKKMFKYDTTVNRQLFEQLRDIHLTKAKSILFHIIAAKQVWIKRLNNQDLKNIVIWPEYSLDQVEQQIDNNRESYQRYLSNLSDKDLTDNLHYANSKGSKFETPIGDILSHVLIHGGHHRGQIARYVREAGGEPINTDYITYVRNRQSN